MPPPTLLPRFAEDDSGQRTIMCVDMHTTGEPTRIQYHRYPQTDGTLLQQRGQALREFDHLRRFLMLEPRGHHDMYGAVLRFETELIESGEADAAVLFLHNQGYSTMCGHATIALGRFLVDMHDPTIFPYRKRLAFDPHTQTTLLRLHVPCGLIRVTVPTTPDGMQTDTTRPVSFVSTPSFVTGMGVSVSIPETHRWHELGGERSTVNVDVVYGGAFYCLVTAEELGFPASLARPDIDGLGRAARGLKAAFTADERYKTYLEHPRSKELGFLYAIMIVDANLGVAAAGTLGAETGVCFFADGQLDRSPTGSCVSARMALAYAKGRLGRGQSWTYNSLVSNAHGGRGAFVGSIEKVVDGGEEEQGYPAGAVEVRVQGKAFYTGWHSFVAEEADALGTDGFTPKGLDVCV